MGVILLFAIAALGVAVFLIGKRRGKRTGNASETIICPDSSCDPETGCP